MPTYFPRSARAWSGGPRSPTHRDESQQGFGRGLVPVVPPGLDFAIGDLEDSHHRQVKGSTALVLLLKCSTRSAMTVSASPTIETSLSPMSQSFCIGLSLACAACGPIACA